jgi:hypothetical protein
MRLHCSNDDMNWAILFEVLPMNRLHVRLAAVAGGLLLSNLMAAQKAPYTPTKILPPAKTAAHVRITHGPELELANAYDNSAIIRWTTKQPWGHGRARRSRALWYESRGT